LSAQQRSQLLAKKNQDLANVFATQMQTDMGQGSLLSSISQSRPSTDAMVNAFLLQSRGVIGQGMQYAIGQNPSLASQQYSSIAASYNTNPMLANSYLNNNVGGNFYNSTALNGNPLNMFGPNNISSFDMTSGYWDPTASSNLGNMALGQLGQQNLVMGQNMLPMPTTSQSTTTQTANLNQPAKFISR